MSDIEKHLRWLRDVSGRTNLEAAAAIEALVKERDDALSVRPSMQKWIDHHYSRAEAAEAEVERLRAALHSITLSYDERCGIDHATLARSALEAKP